MYRKFNLIKLKVYGLSRSLLVCEQLLPTFPSYIAPFVGSEVYELTQVLGHVGIALPRILLACENCSTQSCVLSAFEHCFALPCALLAFEHCAALPRVLSVI